MKQKINLSKQDVIDLFNNGQEVVKCSGLWNDPRTKGTKITSVDQLENFYNWASMVEVFKYDNDPKIYCHGYSGCDMF